jgi:hypothetical protein
MFLSTFFLILFLEFRWSKGYLKIPSNTPFRHALTPKVISPKKSKGLIMTVSDTTSINPSINTDANIIRRQYPVKDLINSGTGSTFAKSFDDDKVISHKYPLFVSLLPFARIFTKYLT